MGNRNQRLVTREQLWVYKICCIFAGIASFAELVILVANVAMGLMTMSISVYLLCYFFLPTLVDVMFLALAFYFLTRREISLATKDYVVCLLCWGICTVLSCVHYVFHPVLCACCIAIFISSMFGNVKLTKLIFSLSLFSIAGAILIGIFLGGENPTLIPFDGGFACVIAGCAYLSANVMTRNEKHRNTSIIRSRKEHKEMERKIQLEPMTGLLNKKVFIQTLEEMMELSKKENTNLYVAMFDLDDFKKINDEYGHVSGDQVLMLLSRILEFYVKKYGYVGRYGGEEFIVLLSEISESKAFDVVENVRKELMKCRFDFAKGKRVTISCGLAHYDFAMDPVQFIELADDRLYRAKARGKNNTVH